MTELFSRYSHRIVRSNHRGFLRHLARLNDSGFYSVEGFRSHENFGRSFRSSYSGLSFRNELGELIVRGVHFGIQSSLRLVHLCLRFSEDSTYHLGVHSVTNVASVIHDGLNDLGLSVGFHVLGTALYEAFDSFASSIELTNGAEVVAYELLGFLAVAGIERVAAFLLGRPDDCLPCSNKVLSIAEQGWVNTTGSNEDVLRIYLVHLIINQFRSNDRSTGGVRQGSRFSNDSHGVGRRSRTLHRLGAFQDATNSIEEVGNNAGELTLTNKVDAGKVLRVAPPFQFSIKRNHTFCYHLPHDGIGENVRKEFPAGI